MENRDRRPIQPSQNNVEEVKMTSPSSASQGRESVDTRLVAHALDVDRVHVLHVSEAVGGGVEAAIRDYVRSTPDHLHSIVFCRRGNFETGDIEKAGFHSVHQTSSGLFGVALGLMRAERLLKPDVVHLHSAWAGLIGRTFDITRSRSSIVYTPHSYYFDRADVPESRRTLARLVETVLARRTGVVAAVSPHEQRSAEWMGNDAVYVPNIVRIPAGIERSDEYSDSVVAIGRLSAQKDPDFYIDVKDAYEVAGGLPREWIWIGDGDEDMKRRLLNAGVKVTGWQPRDATLKMLAGANAYVHSAAWEGSPISLLEVAALGVPHVVRSIPSVVSLGYPADLDSPVKVAGALRTTVEDVEDSPDLSEPEGERVRRQRLALEDVYRRAVRA